MTNHSLDACLRLVADRNRRRVIHHLRHEATEATTLDDLVDQVHKRASDSKNGPLQNREELAIQLHHIHLPKLADHGVVDYDHRSGAVRYDPNEQVEAVLDSLSSDVTTNGHQLDSLGFDAQTRELIALDDIKQILGQIDTATEMDIEDLEQQAKAVKDTISNSRGADHAGDGA